MSTTRSIYFRKELTLLFFDLQLRFSFGNKISFTDRSCIFFINCNHIWLDPIYIWRLLNALKWYVLFELRLCSNLLFGRLKWNLNGVSFGVTPNYHYRFRSRFWGWAQIWMNIFKIVGWLWLLNVRILHFKYYIYQKLIF